MGIRDALRSLRGERKAVEEDITDTEAAEPTWFQPRYDGMYVADETDQQIALRFLPGYQVFESTDGLAGPEQQSPCRGEYTGAGRFNVQRPFERIISYAVLEMEAADAPEPPGFRARRINAADRSTSELLFRFQPDNQTG